MAALKLLSGIVIVLALTELATCKKIKILSNFTNTEDKEFFRTTFPWIVKNVGPWIRVKYYFNDGKDGGERMCVLSNIKHNLCLQADYLKCEADDGEDCLKTLPLNKRKLNRCYKKVQKKIRQAEKQFRRYGGDETPLIVRGRSTQTVHDPMAVLLNICGMFWWKQPPGCIHPSELPQPASTTTTKVSTEPSTTTVSPTQPTKPSTAPSTQPSTQPSTTPVVSTTQSLTTVSTQPEVTTTTTSATTSSAESLATTTKQEAITSEKPVSSNTGSTEGGSTSQTLETTSKSAETESTNAAPTTTPPESSSSKDPSISTTTKK